MTAAGVPHLSGGRAASRELRDAEELLEALSAVRRNARRTVARPAELAPLTGAQLELVRLLRRQPGVSVAASAAALRLAANTVSTLVGQLTEAGLIVRRPDPDDRRVARLELAPQVKRKVDAWRDGRASAVARALKGLTESDRRRLLDAIPALRRLADALEHGA